MTIIGITLIEKVFGLWCFLHILQKYSTNIVKNFKNTTLIKKKSFEKVIAKGNNRYPTFKKLDRPFKGKRNRPLNRIFNPYSNPGIL